VYRLSLRLAGNVGDTDDILQETLLNAMNKWGRFEAVLASARGCGRYSSNDSVA